MLYGCRAGSATDPLVNGNPLLPVTAENANLDKLMGFESGFDFLEHGRSQTVGTYHDDRVKCVSTGAQFSAVGGSQC
jgi:hypothetical protein